jgi:hypothetical protein
MRSIVLGGLGGVRGLLRFASVACLVHLAAVEVAYVLPASDVQHLSRQQVDRNEIVPELPD